MILWFAYLIMGIAGLGTLSCLGAAAIRKTPNDFTMVPVALTALLLLAQIVIAIIAPFAGNQARGDLLEFWLYLIVAFVLLLAAGVWALIERSITANVILALTLATVAVMVYRMCVIWGVW
ncbi:hypothetical protein KJY77_01145 [Canibacter sp. lx-72]|uniref:hypothetical protein n=1 Tax=Canibacter zhuwentaonis TaxID=2837491 RepID=UPI001BDD9619|nr:hypothetical protein [Canibacter zhuwentaonis]